MATDTITGQGEWRTVTCSLCGTSRRVVAGRVLRALRVQARLSLRDLGKCLELSAGYLCDIERDRRAPTDAIVSAYRKLGGRK